MLSELVEILFQNSGWRKLTTPCFNPTVTGVRAARLPTLEIEHLKRDNATVASITFDGGAFGRTMSISGG